MSRTDDDGVNNPDWDGIRARFEAGVSIAQLCRDTGLSRSQIGYRRRKEKWEVTQQHEKNLRVWENLPKVKEQLEEDAESAIPEDGEIGVDYRLSWGGVRAPGTGRAPKPGSGQELDPLTREVAKEIALLMDHQRQVGRARSLVTDIITRLEDVLIKGEVNTSIRVRQTASGKEYLLPFLGHRESVSDALVKVANALQRLVPLERQAHGLLPKEQDAGNAPAVTVNIGNFGPGRTQATVEAGKKPGRVIESEASTIKDATKHLN